jgi:hypothetical protein
VNATLAAPALSPARNSQAGLKNKTRPNAESSLTLV